MIQDIGLATLKYDNTGKAITGHFDALMNIEANDTLLSELLKIPDVNNEQQVMTNAQTLMAAWFLGVEHMEVDDREQHEVRSEIVSCKKHPNGIPAEVVIKFVFATV